MTHIEIKEHIFNDIVDVTIYDEIIWNKAIQYYGISESLFFVFDAFRNGFLECLKLNNSNNENYINL